MYSLKQNEAENLVLTVSGYDLIHELSKENQLLLIESLSCSDNIIEFVLSMLIDEYTITGFKSKNINKHRVTFIENVDLIKAALFESVKG